jgi:hypothetical protein
MKFFVIIFFIVIGLISYKAFIQTEHLHTKSNNLDNKHELSNHEMVPLKKLKITSGFCIRAYVNLRSLKSFKPGISIGYRTIGEDGIIELGFTSFESSGNIITIGEKGEGYHNDNKYEYYISTKVPEENFYPSYGLYSTNIQANNLILITTPNSFNSLNIFFELDQN